jgi:hypothetical protein
MIRHVQFLIPLIHHILITVCQQYILSSPQPSSSSWFIAHNIFMIAIYHSINKCECKKIYLKRHWCCHITMININYYFKWILLWHATESLFNTSLPYRGITINSFIHLRSISLYFIHTNTHPNVSACLYWCCTCLHFILITTQHDHLLFICTKQSTTLLNFSHFRKHVHGLYIYIYIFFYLLHQFDTFILNLFVVEANKPTKYVCANFCLYLQNNVCKY